MVMQALQTAVLWESIRRDEIGGREQRLRTTSTQFLTGRDEPATQWQALMILMMHYYRSKETLFGTVGDQNSVQKPPDLYK